MHELLSNIQFSRKFGKIFNICKCVIKSWKKTQKQLKDRDTMLFKDLSLKGTLMQI